MHNTGLSRIHLCFKVFSEKLLMTWYVLLQWSSDEVDDVCQHQANEIDRPSFAATVVKTRNKHGLSELEQAWLVGDML